MFNRPQYSAFLLFALVLFGVSTAPAQDRSFAEDNLRIEHLTVEDGLSTNLVNTLLQDSRGYLWIGTRQGLNRYDGYDMKVYRSFPGDTTSLSHDWIYTLYETRNGTLWVGTFLGLNRFDIQTGTFKQYLNAEWVNSILETADGTLWVGTDTGVYRFDTGTGVFTPYLEEGEVQVLYETRDGVLWAGSDDGLKRHEASGTFTTFRSVPGDPTSLSHNAVKSILETRDGMLWVGTEAGLNRFDPSVETSDQGPTFEQYLNAEWSYSILEAQDGTLWVGTRHGGLFRLDPSKGLFRQYRHRPGDPMSLSHDTIGDIKEGKGGILWVATSNGLDRIEASSFSPGSSGHADPSFSIFRHYRHRPDDPTSLDNGTVMSLNEAPDGTLWVGIGGTGLNRFDPSGELPSATLRAGKAGTSTGVSKRYHPIPGDATSLSHDFPLMMHDEGDDALWIATVGGGLNRYDYSTDTFTSYRHRSGDSTSLSTDQLWSVEVTRDGTLWIGTEGGGVNKMALSADGSPGALTVYRDQPGTITSLDYVDVIYEAQDGIIWLGSEFGGMGRYDASSDTFKWFRHVPGDPTSLSHNRISEIYEARNGEIWVATGNGLNRLVINPDTEGDVSFVRYTAETTNLIDGLISSILEDDQGYLWLGLMSGTLARFNPSTGHFRYFGPREGIEMGAFLDGALRTSRGMMYFGGTDGLIGFDPARIPENTEPPRLYLTDLWMFNQLIEPGPDQPLKAPLSETSELVLNYKQNDVSIGFVGIHLADPSATRYDYRLMPYDQDWRGVTEQRRATYTGLAPGSYRFEVRAMNSDGIWTEEPTVLNMTITPPWWRTTWAYVLYGLLFIGVLVAVDRMQRRRLIARERERARERELEQAREIERAYHELRQAKDRLVQQEKLASLGQLTAGIAHEIKNPLNFVNNFAEMVGELADELSDEVESTQDASGADSTHHFKEILSDLRLNAEQIAKHGRRADGIVSAMMQHASGGTGQREPTDVNALLEEYVNLAYHGKRVQIEGFTCEIQRDYDEAVGNIEMIPQDIGRVFLNLLSNAFDAVQEKNRAAGEVYQPTVRVQTRRMENAIEIRVMDNGPGINKDSLARIFEPFYTTKPTGSGTGLGLSLSYDIITQGHGGTLGVESTEGEGTTFIITLPG